MANNFKVTGDYYVSKAGSDSNNGTSPNTPKATISAACTAAGTLKSIIIGTGTYEEAPTVSTFTTLLADGIVVLRGNGTNAFNIGGGNMANFKTIENFSTISIISQGYVGAINITFNNCNLSFTGTSGGFTNCVFINCSFTQAASTTLSMTGCIFINCTSDYLFSALKNCYVNSASTLKFVTSITAANFDYNNYEGNIIMQSGAAAGTSQNFAAHRSSYPTFNTHSFSSAPLFNNVSRLDFSLQATSPHLGASSTGGNIGNTNYAISKPINSAPEWLGANGATISNLVFIGQDLAVAPGYSYGTVTSAPIALGTTPQTIKNLGYVGLLLFNKSQSGGSSTNQNVPDASVYAGNDASGGGNPDRLVCEIRTSTLTTLPGYNTNADWDNNGLTPTGGAGTWIKVGIIGQPFIDVYEKGSGEPAYDLNYKQTITGTYLQVRYTLTNSYT